ncbi:tail protein X [Caviibacterium pharyngocola]|uniref:Phage tail protein n=1 Tax=Caviibacterium pharyngocola TaxID=28159 RepID=A0A2M8RT94_9PAST|nr:tail protein X [Caviibacterium pharyngocola]PJG82116.1 phage tail protein [Caviibacterium pharyngocola]
MSRTVYAQQNDNLDTIVYRYFGSTLGLVEQVLELNPRLAGQPILELGTAVILPSLDDIQPTTDKSTLNLWD